MMVKAFEERIARFLEKTREYAECMEQVHGELENDPKPDSWNFIKEILNLCEKYDNIYHRKVLEKYEKERQFIP